MKTLPILFLAAASFALAEDFKLTDGTVLRDVTVQRKSAEELQVLHAEGARHIRYDQLPRELQERFGMTPEQVEAHRTELEQDAAERRQEVREREQARLKQLADAGTKPRYLSGADVLNLLAPLESVSMRECSYLAARWNREEAERLGLDESAGRFATDSSALKGDFDAARAEFLREYHSLKKTKEELARERAKREAAEKEAARLRQVGEELLHENNKLWKALGEEPRRSTTILVPPSPVIVPPVIVPGPAGRPPRPPQSKPAPRPARPAKPSKPSVAPSAPNCPPGDHSHTRRH